MDVLLLFEPFAKGRCMEYLLKVISNRLSIKVEKVFDWGLRGVIRVDGIDFAELAKVLKSVACVSMAYLIHSYVRPSHFELIAEEVIKLVEHVFKGAEVFIDVRRWDKSYPLTSIEIAKAIAKAITEKGLAIPNPRAENTVFIGVDKGFTVVGYAHAAIVKLFERPSIPPEITKNIVAIIDRPQTDYEIMDLIQLSRALGFELRLYKPSKKAVEKVLNILGLERLWNVLTVEELDKAFSGIDAAIALSMYAKENEKKLAELAKTFKGKRIALVLGNEFEDVSLELRERCLAEVRLGPLTGFTMRSSTALAYALGVVIYVQAF